MSNNITGIILFFHPQEKYFPTVIPSTLNVRSLMNPGDYCVSQPAPMCPTYVASGVQSREDGRAYYVTTYSFYYTENMAIGFGWRLNPTASCLGYHPHDIEYVSIYRPLDNGDAYVYFSAHSRTQGMWKRLDDCEKTEEGELCVYVSLNSHACYPAPKTYWRCFGFANDRCSIRGESRRCNMFVDAQDYMFPNGVRLYATLRPPPPPTSITPLKRFFAYF